MGTSLSIHANVVGSIGELIADLLGVFNAKRSDERIAFVACGFHRNPYISSRTSIENAIYPIIAEYCRDDR